VRNAETHFAPLALNIFGLRDPGASLRLPLAITFRAVGAEPSLTVGLLPRSCHSQFFLYLLLSGAIAARDMSLVGSFFNGVRNRLTDAFVED
jgi:hypothetical protein